MGFRRCPDCGAEWWDEERCTDCGATLVEVPVDGGDDEPAERVGPGSGDVAADAEPPRLARFLGFMIDYLVLSVFGAALSVATGHQRTRIVGGRHVREQVVPTVVLVVYGVFVLVYATVSVAGWGRTPGMLATGVAVEPTDRASHAPRPSWVESVLRALIGMGWLAVPALIPENSVTGTASTIVGAILYLWPIVVYAPILFDQKRRGLHDIATGTEVVRRPTRSIGRQLPWLSSMGRGRWDRGSTS
jgi:uncharacterized RDD family membrane protein YckC